MRDQDVRAIEEMVKYVSNETIKENSEAIARNYEAKKETK